MVLLVPHIQVTFKNIKYALKTLFFIVYLQSKGAVGGYGTNINGATLGGYGANQVYVTN
jgi:hypothetical protein